MAHLIPTISVEEIENKPERDVARALVEQLPNHVTIYHSYPWLRKERNDRTHNTTLKEGEADFLILWPELGLLVLEVKGGDIRYQSDSRRWYRQLGKGRERDIKDPFEQANKNMRVVIEAIQEKVYADRLPNFAFGYAVVFPDCTYSGSPPPGAQPAIVLSANDLPRMEDRIAKALRQWSRRDPPREIPKEELQGVKRAILPQFNILPVLFRTIEEQEEKLFRLTEDQIRLLEFLGDNERVAIEGVAGSGKTLMAKAQAQHFAEQGKRTLFLCYNKSLGEWLRGALPEEHEDLIHVYHFHKLCSELCRKASISFRPPQGDSSEFWCHEAPELLWEAIEGLSDRYDAVVVDEGQDFHTDWWDPLELINTKGEEGYLYVFYDPAQNLYNDTGVTIPSLGKPFPLPTNCRNTKAIASTCGDVIDRTIETRRGTPLGIETEIISIDDDQETIRYLNGWVKNWIKREGIKPSQIAILSPFKKNNSSLSSRGHFSGITLTEDLDDWRKSEGILFSTIRSFKGLEADIVVMVDIVEPGSIGIFSQSDLYVGCSRAKHVLKILTQIPRSSLLKRQEETR
ncbi:MAG: NERD domain-containing protein [Candidatus Thiodiazotropha lotti]|nr:NERD domain-containing protein [Candidatus Thiodiazotropha lotti]MCW4222421.1 NERD domain-containing protein [Candidatus Thiodiazotropha lotti]